MNTSKYSTNSAERNSKSNSYLFGLIISNAFFSTQVSHFFQYTDDKITKYTNNMLYLQQMNISTWVGT